MFSLLKDNRMKLIHTRVVVALGIGLVVPSLAWAQADKRLGYLVDGSGNIVTNVSGNCWRLGQWTPALAVEPCDPTIKKAAVLVPKPMESTPVAAAPVEKAVVPVPVPVPVRILPQRVNFSADAFFDFDKAVLKSEGKVMLDDVADQLKDVSVGQIEVTGHTDRLGSNAYNQKLSTERAKVVRDYLVSIGVAANRIDAKGMGETQPMTTADQCPGKQIKALIACLQPDRRVDVELQGMKTAQP
jgi:OOP family OmpA-OmpF porin